MHDFALVRMRKQGIISRQPLTYRVIIMHSFDAVIQYCNSSHQKQSELPFFRIYAASGFYTVYMPNDFQG